jgi:hypothetical protein
MIVEPRLFVPFNSNWKPFVDHCIPINGTMSNGVLVADVSAGADPSSVFVPV